jgi:hypothetical protein
MRKLVLSLLFVGGLVGALASPAGAASESACNRGTMHAHHVVPHDAPAHARIPHC